MSEHTYLLISGAWHSGRCWRKVVERLEQAGDIVFAPDLRGTTLNQWLDGVCGLIEAQVSPVILVGHSRGGIVISQAAERLPDKIKALAYVSGFLLRRGDSVLRVLREHGNSAFLRDVALSQDKSEWLLDRQHRREIFYDACDDTDVELAHSMWIPEPAAPMMTPLKITDKNFGRVPRAYIHCLRDRAVPLQLQKSMVAASPCKAVWSLDTDHSPFLSAPDELAALLMGCAELS